jgi:polyhydroxybutyrate depolymerase
MFIGPMPATPPGNTSYIDRPMPSVGCGRRPPAPPGQATTITIGVDPTVAAGATHRTYRVHIPAGYQPRVAVPAVLFFHGYGGSAAAMDATTGLSELADRRGFLAVYPQGLAPDGSPSWADAGRIGYGIDDLRYTADLLNHLQGQLCVDPRRVYAAGFSNGGGMTGWLACELAGRIAAFAMVSGAFSTEPGASRADATQRGRSPSWTFTAPPTLSCPTAAARPAPNGPSGCGRSLPGSLDGRHGTAAPKIPWCSWIIER